jgi:Na+/proline symporter
MIVSGAGLAHDIYAKIVNPEASESQKMWANRAAIVVLDSIPFFLAIQRELIGGLVGFIVVLQASIIGGMFFMPVLLGLHWKRANTWGGLAGMVLGFLTVVLWHIGTEVVPVIPEGLLSELDPVIPGAIVSLLSVVVLSFATGKPSRESIEGFFDVSEDDYREPPATGDG